MNKEEYCEFVSSKEQFVFVLTGVMLVLGFLTLVMFFRQLYYTDEDNSVITKVINTEERKAIVMDNGFTLLLKDDYDANLFVKYIGKEILYTSSSDVGKKSRLLRTDLISAKCDGNNIPSETPYYYRKFHTFYLSVFVMFFVTLLLCLFTFMNYKKRTSRILSARMDVFKTINHKIQGLLSVKKEGSEECGFIYKGVFQKQLNDFLVVYSFAYSDSSKVVFFKIDYFVSFYLCSLLVKNNQTGEMLLDMTEKYKKNKIDSNLFHPEDVLPFANQILDEIDEELSLKLSESKI